MNLDLLYQWPGGRQWFSAGDIVRGCVVIDAPRTEQIESAVIFLYGLLYLLQLKFFWLARSDKQLTEPFTRASKSLMRMESR